MIYAVAAVSYLAGIASLCLAVAWLVGKWSKW